MCAQGAAPGRMCREDLDKLKKGLKITQFRAGQLACVEAIALQRADTWVQMPCGGGKSLVFAAVLNLKGCIGLLVEPLNAIAGTMAPYLRDRGVDTLELTSDTRASVISRIRRYQLGKDKPLAIITSPEQLLHASVLRALGPPPASILDEAAAFAAFQRGGLASVLPRNPVALFAVDEAHVIASWGDKFRPDFGRLGEVTQTMERWPARPGGAATRTFTKLAMTATATPRRRRVVKSILGFDDKHGFDLL